jgi:hypothetical protein
MKVIKVGTSCQARIAQACDRCRSKKIRCDGIRPSCTQCTNVGFECKTSDKLSRRAFPRGYTESLEERVRLLEAEVRELKDLLDEKDEKIDMLSRMHSHSPSAQSAARRPSTLSSAPSEAREESQEKDETFKVQQSPFLLDDANHDAYFAGSSSGRTLVGMLYINYLTFTPDFEQRPSNRMRKRQAGYLPMSARMPSLEPAVRRQAKAQSASSRSKHLHAWSLTK